MVGFGGYVCIPVARAAEQRGIPVVVHEQNSVMGMANKYLARQARAVCLTYEHAAQALSDKSKVVLTGNPVRASVFAATRAEGRAAFGVPEDARMLLVTGGSLGARHLNAAIVARARTCCWAIPIVIMGAQESICRGEGSLPGPMSRLSAGTDGG